MSEGDVIYKTVPDFSPEIHEYTLYLPDFTKGIYGLGVSSYSEPVLSTYVNHNGERESVNLNAYAKYGNYQAMDYIVDYGPGENTMQIHSKSGTKDYLVHVKRILSLGYLKAAYQGTEYVLYMNGKSCLQIKTRISRKNMICIFREIPQDRPYPCFLRPIIANMQMYGKNTGLR